ncbi:MAG: hypothetical protein PUF61_00615 [Spirochaetales bacterium]|nr:hypothetical protein [Spirochaetales bacterium]
MQKFRFTGSFIISFVLNLMLNLEWAVLAFVLFLLHKFVKLPLWPCLAALGIWAGGVLIITLVFYLIGPWGSGAEPAEPSNKNPYSACAAWETAAMSGGAAQAVQSEADRAAAFNAQSARTSMASKPVQYQSELARAIMQPKTYSQTSATALQDQPQNGEGTK